MTKDKKSCSHKTLEFSKGNNQGVECQKCGQAWERVREYRVTTMGYKAVSSLQKLKEFNRRDK